MFWWSITQKNQPSQEKQKVRRWIIKNNYGDTSMIDWQNQKQNCHWFAHRFVYQCNWLHNFIETNAGNKKSNKWQYLDRPDTNMNQEILNNTSPWGTAIWNKYFPRIVQWLIEIRIPVVPVEGVGAKERPAPRQGVKNNRTHPRKAGQHSLGLCQSQIGRLGLYYRVRHRWHQTKITRHLQCADVAH